MIVLQIIMIPFVILLLLVVVFVIGCDSIEPQRGYTWSDPSNEKVDTSIQTPTTCHTLSAITLPRTADKVLPSAPITRHYSDSHNYEFSSAQEPERRFETTSISTYAKENIIAPQMTLESHPVSRIFKSENRK